MTKGISEQSKQLRRHLLNQNGPDLVRRMQESGMADPVGMIIEITDDIGNRPYFSSLRCGEMISRGAEQARDSKGFSAPA